MNLRNKVTGELSTITTYDPTTGEITGLVPIGNTTLGSNANVTITGGNVGEVLTTDGAGNLSWSTGGSGGSYSNVDANAFMAGALVGDIVPAGNNAANLGSPSNQFQHLYLSNATIYFNGYPLTVGTANGVANTLLFNSLPVVTSDGNSNITTSGNVVAGNIVADGNIVANTGYFFLGDGGLLSNITVSAGSAIVDGNSNVTVTGMTGSVEMGANGVSNVAVINESNATFIANVVASQFLYPNGSPITINYANSNVFSYLPTYQGDLGNVGNITSDGNISAVYFLGDGGLLSNIAAPYGDSNVETLLASGNIATDIITTANVSAANVAANNVNVAAAGAVNFGSGGNIYSIPTGGLTGTMEVNGINDRGISLTAGGPTPGSGYAQLQWVQDVTSYNPYDQSGSITNWVYVQNDGTYIENFDLVNSPGYSYTWKFGTDGNFTAAGRINAAGNITAPYFIGNGSQLTGLPSGYANADVAALLASGNVSTNIITTANVSAGNLTVSGLSALGNVGNVAITGGNVGDILTTDGTGNLTWEASILYTVPPVYIVAPFAGNNQTFSNTILASYTSNTAMTVFYNGALLENTYYTLSGDTITINIPLQIGDGIDVVTTVASTVNSIVSSGYGNSNVAAYLPLYTGALANLAGDVTTTANVTAATVSLGAGNIQITGNNISSAGDTITIDPLGGGLPNGNVIVAGNLQVTGNLTYNDVVNATTNDLQWIAANNAINPAAAQGGGISVGPLGAYASFTYNSGSNVWQSSLPILSNGGVNANGALSGATTGSFSGNVSAPYFIGNGSQLTGLPANYGNGDVANYLASNANVVVTTTGNVTTTANVAAAYFLGNGSQLTSLPVQSLIANGNSNVSIAAAGGNITLNVTGSSVGTIGVDSVAIGSGSVAGANSVSIGAGTGQGANANTISIGLFAGSQSQNTDAIAIGQQAGYVTQQVSGIAIGTGAATDTQGAYSVAIGFAAAQDNQSSNSVAVGYQAGYFKQAGNAVAVGINAGKDGQHANSIAIGPYAGYSQQSGQAVAIGDGAGQTNQSVGGIAIGRAGTTNQQGNAIAIGSYAALTSQGSNAIAIGSFSGGVNQAANSISIGANAQSAAAAIVLNASGANLLGGNAGFYVNPVRNDVTAANTAQVVTYNTTSNELTYANTLSLGGVVTASQFISVANIANATDTRLRLTTFGANSYIQTGNGTVLSTGNIIFAPWFDTTAKVIINTTTGNITANNLGNVSALNLNGNAASYLNGAGTWTAASGGTSGQRNITKIDQCCGQGVTIMVADGRVFAMKGYGDGHAWTSALGQNQNIPQQRGMNNAYEIVFSNETSGTCVDAGTYGLSAYALFSNGNLYTWGYNGYGQLGVGDYTSRFIPTLSNTGVAAVYTHSSNAGTPEYTRLVMKKTNNTYWGCGHNAQYQLGIGNLNNQPSWVQLTWINPNALSVWNLGADLGNLLVQQADGSIWVTGWNNTGVLGINSTATPNYATVAPLWTGGDATMRIISIHYGGPYNDGNGRANYVNMVLFMDNGTTSRIVGAGSNNWGSLGTGNTTNSLVPVAPLTSSGMTGRVSKVISSGSAPMNMYVLLATGDLYSYGYNSQGQCGNGSNSYILTPFKMASSVQKMLGDVQGWSYNGYYTQSPFIKLSTGWWACGYNGFGSLGNGNGDSQNVLSRLLVPKDIDFKFIGCYGHNEGLTRYGVTSDNVIWGWGYNSYSAIDPFEPAWQCYIPLQFTPNGLKSL